MSAALIVPSFYLPIPSGMKYYTLKDDDVYFSLGAALSVGWFDLQISRGRPYRNTFPAGEIGRAWQASVGQPTHIPPMTGDTLFPEAFDDRLQQVAPRNTILTITYMGFFDDALAAGHLLTLFPESLFETFSPSIPTRY